MTYSEKKASRGLSHYVIYCKHMGSAWEFMSGLSVLSGSKHGKQSAYHGTNTAIKHDMKAKVDSDQMFAPGYIQHMFLPSVMQAKTKYNLVNIPTSHDDAMP